MLIVLTSAQPDLPRELDSRARRPAPARRVPALPERGVAVLRRRVLDERRVCTLRRALARGRGARAEEGQGFEGGVEWMYLRALIIGFVIVLTRCD